MDEDEFCEHAGLRAYYTPRVVDSASNRTIHKCYSPSQHQTYSLNHTQHHHNTLSYYTVSMFHLIRIWLLVPASAREPILALDGTLALR